MKPLKSAAPDLGTADVYKLIHPSRARLFNPTDEDVVIDPRAGLSKEERAGLAALVIRPHDFEEREFSELARYDVDAAIKERGIERVPVEPFVTVTNKTAKRIWIEAAADNVDVGHGLIIAAFGSRKVGAAALRGLKYAPWVEQNLIGIEPEKPGKETSGDNDELLGGLTVGWLVLGAIFLPKLKLTPVLFWTVYVGGLVLLVLAARALAGGQQGERSRLALAQWLNVLTLIVLSASLPFAAQWALSFPSGASAAAGAAHFTLGWLSLPVAFRLTVMGLLVLLPGLLYFQYERQRVASLRDRFFREIMLLNPNVRTTDDARIMYDATVDEVSGAIGDDSRQVWLFSRGRPVLISTLMIALGWIYVFLSHDPAPATLAAAMTVKQDVFAFAFLGAYFFGIQLLFRRYSRADLTPKVYSHIVVRLVCAMPAAWLLSVIAADGLQAVLLPVAFLCGVVPETSVALARDAARKWLAFLPSLEETHPITDLEGINLYDRVRLIEEGVDNVENLAHHDLIELMLRSRIPTPRLVDLVDQAILYLHVRDGDGDSRKPLRTLKALGIRTASDLLQACESLDPPAAGASAGAEPPRPKRDQLLGVLGPEEATSPRALEVVLRALNDDEWFDFVWHWRQQGRSAGLVYTIETLTNAMRPSATRTPAPATAAETTPRMTEDETQAAPEMAV